MEKDNKSPVEPIFNLIQKNFQLNLCEPEFNQRYNLLTSLRSAYWGIHLKDKTDKQGIERSYTTFVARMPDVFSQEEIETVEPFLKEIGIFLFNNKEEA